MSAAPAFLGFTGCKYGMIAIVSGLFFVYMAVRVLLSDEATYAKNMFGYSILYIFVLFLGIMIDAT